MSSESERLINLIYALLFSEEDRLLQQVENMYYLLKYNVNDSYYIAKYLYAVQTYEQFKTLRGKICDILKRF